MFERENRIERRFLFLNNCMQHVFSIYIETEPFNLQNIFRDKTMEALMTLHFKQFLEL